MATRWVTLELLSCEACLRSQNVLSRNCLSKLSLAKECGNDRSAKLSCKALSLQTRPLNKHPFNVTALKQTLCATPFLERNLQKASRQRFQRFYFILRRGAGDSLKVKASQPSLRKLLATSLASYMATRAAAPAARSSLSPASVSLPPSGYV